MAVFSIWQIFPGGGVPSGRVCHNRLLFWSHTLSFHYNPLPYNISILVILHQVAPVSGQSKELQQSDPGSDPGRDPGPAAAAEEPSSTMS